MKQPRFIDTSLHGKRILLRVDYNVSLNKDHTIANDTRIKQTLPTIHSLIEKENTLVLLAHLGEPKGYDSSLSLKTVCEDLQSLLPSQRVTLFPTIQALSEALPSQTPQDIFVLENLRFFTGEEANSQEFATSLSRLGEIYMNDAFSVSHRAHSSIVGLPTLLPSFAGLLFQKELTTLSTLLTSPTSPFVVVMGGAKISTKLPLIQKLTAKCDHLLTGGGIANTILYALGKPVGKSVIDREEVDSVRKFLTHLSENNTSLLVPTDVRVGDSLDATQSRIKHIDEIEPQEMILDIGDSTSNEYTTLLSQAKTILWNGPLGYTENPLFAKGTHEVFFSISQNSTAFSVIGGGETLTSIAHEKGLEQITHISTAGGAMLEYLETGTLVGLEALLASV